MIYLDHNSTTELLEDAKNAMVLALAKPFNPSAIHGLGREGKKIIEQARRQIASLSGIINHFRNYYITFTASGTEANNLIISNFNNGEVFVSAIEHASILAHVKFANNIQIISVDENGIVNLEELKKKLSSSSAEKKLVSIIFANNETGVIQDIKQIAKVAHDHGALIHSDCVQAFGKIPVNLAELDIDFATISAHKIGGPVGTGALIRKAKYHLLPLIIGGGQEMGLRSGTENVAAIAGFGVAAEIASKELESRYKHLKELRDYLEKELVKNFSQIKIVNQQSERLPNTSLIINLGKKAETQIIALDLKNIAISSGAACSSGKIGSSKTLEAMGFNEEERDSAIRISLGYTTTQQDIDKFLKIYREINS